MDDQLTGNAGHVQPPDSPPDAEVALPTNSAQPFAPVAVAEGLGKVPLRIGVGKMEGRTGTGYRHSGCPISAGAECQQQDAGTDIVLRKVDGGKLRRVNCLRPLSSIDVSGSI